MAHVRSELTLPGGAGATFKVKKCCSSANTIAFLGKAVLQKRLEVASHTTYAISEARKATIQIKLSYFLSQRNVFRLFIPNPVGIAAPHYRQL